ncbi:MAG: PilT/PilU family type 4a pilus ATPase [Verrucomicrobiota bacterium]|nr:PilT/PilU family type 4a pilus ATPase [Verrucomicrobiota bacterium]
MTRDIVDALLTGMLQTSEGVSDLLFVAGKPPLIETHGRLIEFPIDTPDSVLTAELIESLARQLINGNDRLTSDLAKAGSCDCSYSLGKIARFRVNIFKQAGRHAIVMRRLQSAIPTLEKLGLPPVFHEIIKEKNGIVFLTGGTGSGKTTTLAAMLNELNRTQEIHILTLEDPIEFLHPHQRAAISQRELGKDFFSFADGLRAALRQAPKVILVGEIRDRETMEIAMTAAETGHVVFSTLHTINAGQTISRILGMFSREEEQQLRQRLAETLRYVISQRLVPKIGGGRLMVSEIMGASLRTRETILYGESEGKTFGEIIEAGSTLGWHSFDQALLCAYEAAQVTEETAMLYCSNKGKFRRELDAAIKRQGAHETQAPSGLKLNVGRPEVKLTAVAAR